MNKRRRPPSEQRAEKANQILADMVLGTPRSRASRQTRSPAQGAAPTDGHPTTIPRVKTEEEDVPIAKFQPQSVGKPLVLSLVDFSYVLSLVFGGCCSNVYTYEYLLKLDPHLGTALTFSQMLFVTLHSLPSFLVWSRPHWLPSAISISMPTLSLKPRQVPLTQWALQVLVLTTGSLLNNWAFGFQVPLTVQIIFRSAGLAVSMLFGRLFLAKRYSTPQIGSVLLVTLGVILATTSNPTQSKPRDTSHSPIDLTQYSIGVSMLTVSLMLTGVLGLLQERTYTRYGPCWKEGVFYTHALSLPIFLIFIPSVQRGFRSLNRASSVFPSQRNHTASSGTQHDLTEAIKVLLSIPPAASFNFRPYLVLLVNLITQLVCVSGVNQMTSRISSVSTNIVLTTRKAISLCFSVWWFGNGWNTQLGMGASMVFMGSLLYTIVTSRSSAPLKASERPTTAKKEAKKLEREPAVKLESPSPDGMLTRSKAKGKGRARAQ